MTRSIDKQEQRSKEAFDRLIEANVTQPTGQFQVRVLGKNELGLRLAADSQTTIYDWATSGDFVQQVAAPLNLPKPEEVF